MADNDFFADDEDELDQEIELDSLLLNKRISVRYRRKDIKAIVKTHSLFFPRLIKVDLLDISSKGAAILSDKKLKLKSRVSFFLQFNDGRRFTIDAIVAHNHSAPRYGLKFSVYQTELAEHLLTTQTDLQFG
ncbi:PilZ domain-containing protein [Methylomonas sp. LL1]|uniref:PilZ domain-containing protein n=1 Tax=Methylomonas sp. LL1 TaxID=2785785 RepID=UPI0018C3AE9E|nr:PilZ domain-containing protein [Methylomonas sp. LL1]QPK63839.1 PilZ domain-containing protein [Methylomonas sp. LL1]